MNEKVAKFYETVSADGALREEFTAVTESVNLDGIDEREARAAMAEAVAAFAADHDLDLSADDILAADADAAEGELSEDELANVSGGHCGCFVVGAAHGCGCFIAGSATWKDDEGGMVCVIGVGA